ncbi:MAG TPA: response regulator transcription factor [Verrucomicrobiae bacterium]|nr:response regulator transcription factor [Verrucomicrobiae bacterium]
MNRVRSIPHTGAKPTRLDSGVHTRTSKPKARRTVRVLLADDHPVVRWGLSCYLAPQRHLEVIGEAGNGLEAVRKARELCPDVILMDISMPELNGLAATEILHRERPEIKVLLISMYPYSGQMPRILRSGARGVLLKDSQPAEMVAAIRKVAAGQTCFSPAAARQALQDLTNKRGCGTSPKVLSEREEQVLVGIAEGFSNKDIARHLNISARTIETHRGHIMRKLKIHSIAGLTRFAIAEGLVEIHQPIE